MELYSGDRCESWIDRNDGFQYPSSLSSILNSFIHLGAPSPCSIPQTTGRSGHPVLELIGGKYSNSSRLEDSRSNSSMTLVNISKSIKKPKFQIPINGFWPNGVRKISPSPKIGFESISLPWMEFLLLERYSSMRGWRVSILPPSMRRSLIPTILGLLSWIGGFLTPTRNE